MIFFSKLKDRLVNYKSCRIYLGITLLQLTVILVLVALVFSNTSQTIVNYEDTYYDSELTKKIYLDYLKLQKMYYEAIMCIIFEGWKTIIIIDAVLEVNTLLVYSIVGLSIFSFAIYLSTAIEYANLFKAAALDSLELAAIEVPLVGLNKILTISCACLSFVFIIPNIWISRKVAKEFGWGIYKKIGASMTLQKMYRISQLFSVMLKINVVFELAYVILVMLNTEDMASLAFQIPIPIAIFLSILLGREIIARESHILMILFYCAQASLIGTIITILAVPIEGFYLGVYFFVNWYAFAIYTILALLFCITTIVLGILCEINFGKGLKQYVQWSFYGLRRSKNRKAQALAQEMKDKQELSNQEELIDLELN